MPRQSSLTSFISDDDGSSDEDVVVFTAKLVASSPKRIRTSSAPRLVNMPVVMATRPSNSSLCCSQKTCRIATLTTLSLLLLTCAAVLYLLSRGTPSAPPASVASPSAASAAASTNTATFDLPHFAKVVPNAESDLPVFNWRKDVEGNANVMAGAQKMVSGRYQLRPTRQAHFGDSGRSDPRLYYFSNRPDHVMDAAIMCNIFEMPRGQQLEMTAFDYIITKVRHKSRWWQAVHHMNVFACRRAVEPIFKASPFFCESERILDGQWCDEDLFVYDRGAQKFTYPNNIGKVIGNGTPFDYLVVEYHYLMDSGWPFFTPTGFIDTSAVELTLRANEESLRSVRYRQAQFPKNSLVY